MALIVVSVITTVVTALVGTTTVVTAFKLKVKPPLDESCIPPTQVHISTSTPAPQPFFPGGCTMENRKVPRGGKCTLGYQCESNFCCPYLRLCLTDPHDHLKDEDLPADYPKSLFTTCSNDNFAACAYYDDGTAPQNLNFENCGCDEWFLTQWRENQWVNCGWDSKPVCTNTIGETVSRESPGEEPGPQNQNLPFDGATAHEGGEPEPQDLPTEPPNLPTAHEEVVPLAPPNAQQTPENIAHERAQDAAEEAAECWNFEEQEACNKAPDCKWTTWGNAEGII